MTTHDVAEAARKQLVDDLKRQKECVDKIENQFDVLVKVSRSLQELTGYKSEAEQKLQVQGQEQTKERDRMQLERDDGSMHGEGMMEDGEAGELDEADDQITVHGGAGSLISGDHRQDTNRPMSSPTLSASHPQHHHNHIQVHTTATSQSPSLSHRSATHPSTSSPVHFSQSSFTSAPASSDFDVPAGEEGREEGEDVAMEDA
jgi:hypothetical protein